MFFYHECEHVLSFACVHSLSHPNTLSSYYVQNDSISFSLFTPKTLFPLYSTLASKYPKEPVSLWTCFSVNQLGAFPSHFHLSSSAPQPREKCQGQEKGMREGRIGDCWTRVLQNTWESPINRDSDFVAHTTKPYTFFDNISMILDMEKNPVLILALWAQNSVSLELIRSCLLNRGCEREVWGLKRIFSSLCLALLSIQGKKHQIMVGNPTTTGNGVDEERNKYPAL